MLCLLIGGSGVGYVWQKGQISDLGKQVLKREEHMADLLKKNEDLKRQLNGMRSQWALEKSITDFKLGLGRPQQGQIWPLPEPSREAPRTSQESRLATRDAVGRAMP